MYIIIVLCIIVKRLEFVLLQIMEEIHQHGIHVYPLPECDTDEEEDYKLQVSIFYALKKHVRKKQDYKLQVSIFYALKQHVRKKTRLQTTGIYILCSEPTREKKNKITNYRYLYFML